MESFTKTRILPSVINYHPFGCPACTLDKGLQNQKKISKWESRARMAVYLGPSPNHAQSIGLVLSLRTGLVSTQFHVRYDDQFATVRDKDTALLPTSEWQHKCGFIEAPHNKSLQVLNDSYPMSTSEIPDTENLEVPGVPQQTALQHEETQMEPHANADEDIVNTPSSPPRTTRSGRTTRAPLRFDNYVAFEATPFDATHESQTTFLDPIAYAASSDPDVMYLHEAMQQSDRSEFVRAIEKEVNTHTNNKNWLVVEQDSVPPVNNILPAIWAMRRKRRIDAQEVYKWKARINFHGGKQTKGVR
jgi:hypothetical protein